MHKTISVQQKCEHYYSESLVVMIIIMIISLVLTSYLLMNLLQEINNYLVCWQSQGQTQTHHFPPLKGKGCQDCQGYQNWFFLGGGQVYFGSVPYPPYFITLLALGIFQLYLLNWGYQITFLVCVCGLVSFYFKG